MQTLIFSVSLCDIPSKMGIHLSLLPQKRHKTVRVNAYFILELRVEVYFYFFVYGLSGQLFSG
jgi:hypothetical protein